MRSTIHFSWYVPPVPVYTDKLQANIEGNGKSCQGVFQMGESATVDVFARGKLSLVYIGISASQGLGNRFAPRVVGMQVIS